MNIASMTGFARMSGEVILNKSIFDRTFEIKSVNGKSLDIKLRLPSAYEDLAQPLKSIAGKYLSRGNVSVFLEVSRSAETPQVRINEKLLDDLLQKAISLYRANPEMLQKPSVCDLFAVRGVTESEDFQPDEAEEAEFRKILTENFEELCRRLQEDRCREGSKIKEALSDILGKMEDIVGKIGVFAEEIPHRQKARLEEQLRQWSLPGQNISEDRLAQEVVLYVTRADIREETDRLRAHLKTARELLEADEPVGRRLDFLCQELNREANTTCSKSSEIDLTNLAMDLKALIEQFREQVQNIE